MATRAMQSENKALIRRWFDEVWNQGRHELVDQLRAPDAISLGLGEDNARAEGSEPFKTFFSNLRSAVPNLRVRIEDILADEDKVAVRLSVEGTHSGRGFGASPTGRRVEFTGIIIVRIKNGKIVESWNSLDQLRLLTQLGVVPPREGPDRFLSSSI